MSVSKINFNKDQEAFIVVDPISEIDKSDFKNYLDLDSPSFLKCEFENNKVFTLYYNFADRITLKQFLSQVVEKNEAIGFLKSLTKAFITAEDSGLKTEHILLGINSIFYDSVKKQVSCVYVPVANGILPVRPLRLFLKEMLVNMVYSDDDDMTWLGNTIRYISRNRNFSYGDFYEFLQAQEVNDTKSGKKDETEIVSEAKENQPQEAEADGSVSGPEMLKDSSETSEADTDKDELADLKSVLESIPAAESVAALKIEFPMSEGNDEVKEDATGVDDLLQSEGSDNLESEEAKASLLRRQNHEIYVLKGSVIHIGKSAENDICITDNPAVSRLHAIIQQNDGIYTIRDNHSTNHTLVNGILLSENQEKQLSSGDRILLGNEEFIFKNEK